MTNENEHWTVQMAATVPRHLAEKARELIDGMVRHSLAQLRAKHAPMEQWDAVGDLAARANEVIYRRQLAGWAEAPAQTVQLETVEAA